MRRILVVVAKSPIAGQVKNHLTPPLDAASAATLHKCFVQDTLDKAAAVPDTELVVAFTPERELAFFREAVPEAGMFIPWPGVDAGDTLAACFQELYGPDRSVVAIGTDAPTMPARTFELAFNALSSGGAQVVFGPASNGGCYLLGTSAPDGSVLEGFNWPSLNPGGEGIDLAAGLGLGWYMLPEWLTVDTPQEMQQLKHAFFESSVESPWAPRTRLYMECLRDAGAI
jgi:glycosyltransferase A (GT-A) superfamily protein (DUF2064 family)